MQRILIHTTEEDKNEFCPGILPANVSFVFDFDGFISSPAEAFIDLLFINEPSRIAALKNIKGIVIINSVVNTLHDLQVPLVRINAWPGFSNALLEASCSNEALKHTAETVFQNLGKQIQWLPDEPGFVTPRVISMIINEAYFALEEGVSSKEEIDTAMKLGTAYPYGPFEWGTRIGLTNVVALLNRLSTKKPQYEPAPLLMQEALGAKG
jgi:3-hydroxybutyryl-CoA dehydrogenase